jgi:hypothetical protein
MLAYRTVSVVIVAAVYSYQSPVEGSDHNHGE